MISIHIEGFRLFLYVFTIYVAIIFGLRPLLKQFIRYLFTKFSDSDVIFKIGKVFSDIVSGASWVSLLIISDIIFHLTGNADAETNITIMNFEIENSSATVSEIFTIIILVAGATLREYIYDRNERLLREDRADILDSNQDDCRTTRAKGNFRFEGFTYYYVAFYTKTESLTYSFSSRKENIKMQGVEGLSQHGFNTDKCAKDHLKHYKLNLEKDNENVP